MFGEDEVGGRAGYGDETADGGRVRDAERQTLADHVISLGRVQRVSPDFGFPWWHRNADWSLCLGTIKTILEI